MRLCPGVWCFVLLASAGTPLSSLAAPPANEETRRGILRAVDDLTAKGPFHATWESLETYQIPAWYVDAKFGIFIHWGPCSVPEFECGWYARNMYQQGSEEFKHHVATYGPQTKFGYKDFIPLFRAEKFDADRWAELFRKAGAKFVVPVAEHHDGFALYDCGLSAWCATKMGPRRDLLGELAAAIRKKGLVFGLSSHRAEHWWFFDGGMQFDSDVKDLRYTDLYGPAQPEKVQPDRAFLDDWLARTCELVDKYQPQIVWFDWWIEQPAFKPYLQRFAAYYYNRGAGWKKGVAINYKKEAFPPRAAVLDIERGQLTGIRPLFWQTDTSVSRSSWGHVKNPDYKTVGSLVGDLVDIVSKNGALLLNIGPRADGTIPEAEEKILLEMGRWLAINGEAIYGTRPWEVSGEGPTQIVEGTYNDAKRKPFTDQDIRFTTKDGALYVIVFAWPQKELTIRSLGRSSKHGGGREIADVALLGSDDRLNWTRRDDALVIQMPAKQPCDHAYTFRITFSPNR